VGIGGTTAVWSTANWRRVALAWVAERLAEHGLSIVGDVDQRIRPWATVIRVPTAHAVVWFKASAPATAYEAGLMSVLLRVAPEHVLRPLGLDVERGWLLLPDGGPTLRDELGDDPGERRWARWEQVVPQYAELQRASAAARDDLLVVGVPDMRPQRLPSALVGLLDTAEVTDDLRARIEARLPELTVRCDELAGSPLPAAAQHDDLHDGNVLVSGPAFRFFDWGDSSLGHPLASLIITRSSLARQTGAAVHGPEITRVRDAYLEAFTDLATRVDLERELALVEYVSIVARAAAWARALQGATSEERAQWEGAITACLDALADEAPRM
jgi:hypothetical protein